MSKFENLSGKVAVVTGGASGIGAAIARRLAAEGVDVVIADIDESELARTAIEIGAFAVRTDVSDAASVQALAEATLHKFGTVDLVFNNAGVAPVAPIGALTSSDWRWVLDVNLMGVIHGVQTFLPLLIKNAGGGHIVNTASLGGFVASMPGIGAYSVSKFGVVALSETLAQELAMAGVAVGVSILAPATVRTNIHRSLRSRPAELADGGLADIDLNGAVPDMTWLEPDEVARMAIDGVRNGDLYIFTDAAGWPVIEQRYKAIQAAFTNVAKQ